MTTTSLQPTPELGGRHLASRPRLLPGLAVAAVAAVAAVVGATVLPNVAAGTPMPNMTHYMGLLAANQPWNLLLFMAVPVVLAETVAVTELGLLFSPSLPRPWRLLNRYAGMVLGVYFLVVFGYLLANAAVPLTTSGGWRGPADLIAVAPTWPAWCRWRASPRWRSACSAATATPAAAASSTPPSSACSWSSPTSP
jgi:hypothetical protein